MGNVTFHNLYSLGDKSNDLGKLIKITYACKSYFKDLISSRNLTLIYKSIVFRSQVYQWKV